MKTPRRHLLPSLFAGALLLGGFVVSRATQADEHAHEAKTIYTCGMHPQIVQDEPGTCPICGMNLTPKKLDSGGDDAAPAAAADGPKKERKILYWTAPMNPGYRADKPGKSPMGMDLVPVYEDAGGSTIKIDPTVVQNMGVRIAPVVRGPIFRHVRTVGTVDVAENELSVVNLRFSGWIERIYVDETGVLVKRGKALFDIYSPELVSAQEEYLLALRTGGKGSPLARSARTRLEFWDLKKWQIEKIEAGGKALRTITITAPQTGYVLHKAVVQGARVMAGQDLYRIGNLAKIWVNAEVYEFDAPWIALGQKATMELSFQAGKSYAGTVAYIYPTLSHMTRTLKVRLEFDNPGLSLKPGMFAVVRIEAQRKENALILPTEAILHSGDRQNVFVALDIGRYEMREVITGMVGDRQQTEVLSGLREGERVVTSGQFLLDSESQLQEAVQKLLSSRLHAKEKSVGMGKGKDGAAASGKASSGKAGGEKDHYYTCGMHPQIVQDEPGTCPICGMNLTKKAR